MSIKVLLDVGHTSSAPGACNLKYNICEFEFNKNLADIISYLSKQYFKSFTKYYGISLVKFYRGSYKDMPGGINKENPDVIISLHANAFNTKASGSETLYYSKSDKSKKLAEILQKNINGVLTLPDRGIKALGHGDRGSYLLINTNAPCVIVEPFFIDNDNDFEVVDRNTIELALAILKSIIKIYNYEYIWRN